MKKTFLLLIISVFLLWSCGNNQSTKESDENTDADTEEEVTASGDSNEVKTCDDFLNQYEEWTDEYLEFLEKYKKNPMDSEVMQKYLELSQKGSEWMMQWANNPGMCASDEKYQKRFDEITDKIDKKMKELGFE